MSDQEQRTPGSADNAGSQERQEGANASRLEGAAGGLEGERHGPNWWELRPDPAGAANAGMDQIVTGTWGEGKTVEDAQRLQTSVQLAKGQEPSQYTQGQGTTADSSATATPVSGTAASSVTATSVSGATAPSAAAQAPAAPGGAPTSSSGGGNAPAGVGSGTLGERLSAAAPGVRTAAIARKTNETDIALTFGVDGTGRSEIETDVPFLNHMLDLFTKHGQFDLRVAARGDVDIDDHHTVEDIGICLGKTLREALGDKRGIKRYASVFIPMDETLAQVVIDISNRPHFEYRAQYPSAQVGSFQVELVHEFLSKFALEARVTLHVIVHYGYNTHHMIEAVFKALGRALDEATSIDPRVQGVPSTKGVL